jgi:hypothetical protein
MHSAGGQSITRWTIDVLCWASRGYLVNFLRYVGAQFFPSGMQDGRSCINTHN